MDVTRDQAARGVSAGSGALAVETIATLPATAAAARSEADYQVGVGYLRAFITLSVLSHHAVLAYDPRVRRSVASLLTKPYEWTSVPVVDPARSTSVVLFVVFNDLYFMALMFLISGLFVWS